MNLQVSYANKFEWLDFDKLALIFLILFYFIYLDMDSCACSILTAYLYSVELGLTSNHSNSNLLVLPLINIPRQDLNLRPDIKYLLNKVGIASTSLSFLDDLTVYSLAELGKSKAFLVDHNKLLGPTQKMFEPRVVGIIDHHDDEKQYENEIKVESGPRIIERTGSCSSLVTNYWHSKVGASAFKDDKNLALLALGPLLIDTSGMKSKVEKPDTEAFELLKESLGFSQNDVEEMTKTLDTYKKDVSSLTGLEILRKDYKEWTPEAQSTDANLETGKIGISSVVKSIEWLYKTYDDFENDMKTWGEERHLDVMVVMCSYVNPDNGSFCRDILLWSPLNTLPKKIDETIQEISQQLELRPLEMVKPSNSGIHFFHQFNTKLSRKQVAPLLKLHIQGVSLNSL